MSDVWAAGVMAHQLLTGRFPFDDKTNPFAPSLSKVWCVRAAARGCSRGGALAVAPLGTCVSGPRAPSRAGFTSTAIPPPRTHPPALGRGSILGDEVDFKRSHWEGISEEAKDFVRTLLVKDPLKRAVRAGRAAAPVAAGPRRGGARARQAPRHRCRAAHPGAARGQVGAAGARRQGHGQAGQTPSLAPAPAAHASPLACSPPAPPRLQRYSQGSVFKRNVLEMIAEELMRQGRDAEVGCPIAPGGKPHHHRPAGGRCGGRWRCGRRERPSCACCHSPAAQQPRLRRPPLASPTPTPRPPSRPPPWSTCTST